MTYRPTILGFLFLALAVLFAAIEVLGVAEYVQEQNSSRAIALASCAIAAVTPFLPAFADWCWRKGWFFACAAAWLAIAVCLAIVLTATVQRTGYATDSAHQDRERAERAKQTAERTEADALRDYTAAQSAALKECSDARRKRCLEAEEKAATLRQALVTARSTLVAAPATQSDPLARRLAAVTPLSEEQVRLLIPLLVPIGLSLLSALFFAGWSRLDFSENAAAVPPPHQEAQPPSARPALAITARSHQAGKFGALSAFLVSETEPIPGEAVEVERTLYNAYKTWCHRGQVAAYPPQQFALELAHVGKAAGLTIEIRGREAYCLDRRLAA